MILKRVVKIFAAVLLLSVLMTGEAFAQNQPQFPFQNQPGGDLQRSYQEGIAIQDMRHTWYEDGSSRLEISLYNPSNEDLKLNVNQRVIVRDRNGNIYNTRVTKAERNLIQLVIEKLRSGENYSFEIPDVYFRGTNNTVRGDFKAEDNWRYAQQQQEVIQIQQMRYNKGRLEIRLYNPNNENIRWNKNQPILVRDRNGRTYDTRVLRAENNLIELNIDGLRYGQTYSVEIDVDNRGRNDTVRGDFKAEDNWTYEQQGQEVIQIQQMRYNKGRLEIRLYNPNNDNIRWNKNQPILVRDRNGKTYNTEVTKVGRDMMELKIEGLRYGQTYRAEIGVDYNDRKYTLRGDFKAEDNWKYSKSSN